MFRIPVDKKIEEFQVHLNSHPRTILSAKYGDGKTYFLNQVKKTLKQYEFITVYPIHYQIAKNEDIFNLVKRDILFQMLVKGMINDDYTISNSVALSYFLQNNTTDITEEMLSYLSAINSDDKSFKIILAALATHKLFRNLKDKINNLVRSKNKEDVLLSFFNQTENKEAITSDAITTIIRENIAAWEEKKHKKVILIFEDMDRIDPAHIFRIMNVLSAQMDYTYITDEVNDNTKEDINQFGMYSIVLVLHYENLKSIFAHFYGEDTDFQGYLSKFAPKGYFQYSLSDERNKFIYEQIVEFTGLPLEIINNVIQEDILKIIDLRKIVNSLVDIDKQILKEAYINIDLSTQKIICSAKILRLTVIAQRLNINKENIINQLSILLSKYHERFYKYFAICCPDKQNKREWTLFISIKENEFHKVSFYEIDNNGDAKTNYGMYLGTAPNNAIDTKTFVRTLFDYISQ